jgi:hypothetical protein
MVTNNLELPPGVHVRVLLTSPLETFTVGHTIIISRGLLDVLPDEATLACMLAHELAHIALGHHFDTRWAFNDRTIFPDEATLRRMHFARDSREEQEADAKALVLMQNSPYKDKLASAGLFLRSLEARQAQLPNLIRARLGSPVAYGKKKDVRMSSLMNGAPELLPRSIDQIASLPLGGRIRVDPWSDSIELAKTKPVPLVSANEKMAFEVTPLFPYLYRLNDRMAGNAAGQQ